VANFFLGQPIGIYPVRPVLVKIHREPASPDVLLDSAEPTPSLLAVELNILRWPV